MISNVPVAPVKFISLCLSAMISVCCAYDTAISQSQLVYKVAWKVELNYCNSLTASDDRKLLTYLWIEGPGKDARSGLRVVDAETGALIREILNTKTGEPEYQTWRDTQFSKDGAVVATGYSSLISSQSGVIVHRVATGAVVRDLKLPGRLADFSLSPDGGQILTRVQLQDPFSLWDVQSGKLIRQYEPKTYSGIGVGGKPIILQDGRRALVVSQFAGQVLDLQTGAAVSIEHPAKTFKNAVQYYGDEGIVALGSAEGLVSVLRERSRNLSSIFLFPKPPDTYGVPVSISVDGRRLAAGVVDGTVEVREITENIKLGSVRVATNPVVGVALLRDDNLAVLSKKTSGGFGAPHPCTLAVFAKR